jgi:hypothetical protein
MENVQDTVEVDEETYQAWLSEDDPKDLLGTVLETLEDNLDNGDYINESIHILDDKGNTQLCF